MSSGYGDNIVVILCACMETCVTVSKCIIRFALFKSDTTKFKFPPILFVFVCFTIICIVVMIIVGIKDK